MLCCSCVIASDVVWHCFSAGQVCVLQSSHIICVLTDMWVLAAVVVLMMRVMWHNISKVCLKCDGLV